MKGKIVAFSTTHLRHVPCTMKFEVLYPDNELNLNQLSLKNRIHISLEYISAESGAYRETSSIVEPSSCMNGTRFAFVMHESSINNYDLITDIEIKK